MVVISYSGKEANGKLVYYGPGLGGKTTNLEFIYDSVPASSRGKMVSMKTQTDRTLFFDFLPLDLGELGGFKTRFLLYTVPGQVFYNATRKLVLRGADAIAFIADSQRGKMEENKESLANLVDNLADYDLSLDNIPWVMQYNKRDLPDTYTVEELNRELNPTNVPFFEAVATEGVGVFETFRGLSKLLLEKLSEEIGQRMVIGRSLGSRQKQEEPAEVPETKPHGDREAAAEVESLELTSSDTSIDETAEGSADEAEEVSLRTSESVSEELELIQEEQTGESTAAEVVAAQSGTEDDLSAPSEGEPEAAAVSADEEPVAAENVKSDEEPREAGLDDETETIQLAEEVQQETQPVIMREQERAESFFAEAAESPPLEREIYREEVILSEEPDSAVEPESPGEEQPAETKQLSQEPSADETSPDSDEQEETLDEEASFLGIIRRNNVGVFERKETPEQAKDVVSTTQSGSTEQSLEHIVEVPVRMQPGEAETEIVLTLKLRLKLVQEQIEEQSDEFLLDGISK